MKRIILFRFHKNLSVCRNRLKLLKMHNPTTPIYGLFGGNRKDFSKSKKGLSQYLEHTYYIPRHSSEWKWKNGDLAIRLWFQDYGKDVDFDMLYLIEWDMLVFESIEDAYARIRDGVGLTGLMPLKKIEHIWDWLLEEPSKTEWARLLEYVRNRLNYQGSPYGRIFGGCCLSKKFIEKYASMDIPELCHDELRMPLFAQALGFRLHDTGFYKKWYDKEEELLFNALKKEISEQTIEHELSKKNGRRVFHPYLKIWKL